MSKILDRFKNAIEKDRLSHLYLLSGSTRTQKVKLVRDIAYEIFKSTQDSKNIFHLIDTGNHPNYIMIEKDGLSVKKEQILNLQKEFSKSSLVSGKRIYLIDGIETLSVSAANSLLKFLEEPKDHQTIGFLLTDDISLVLPTILSRTQVIRINDDSKNYFIESLKQEQIDLIDIKFLSEITLNVEEAKQLVTNANYIKAKELILEFKEKLLGDKQFFLETIIKMSTTFGSDKEWLIFILNIISLILLDAMHIHMNLKSYFDFMKDDLISLVNMYKVNQLQLMIKKIHEVNSQLKLPINVFMAFSSFSIQIEEIIIDGKA